MLKPALRNRCSVDSCRLPFGRPTFRTLRFFSFMALLFRWKRRNVELYTPWLHLTSWCSVSQIPLHSIPDEIAAGMDSGRMGPRRAPWGTLDTERWTGNDGCGCTVGEGSGRRPGQDPPLPSAQPPRIGGLVRLHAQGYGR